MLTPSNEFAYWNDPAVAADLQTNSEGISGFARSVEPRMPRGARVVELGAGAGDDAAYFAKHDHSVIALDVSSPLVELAAQRFADIPNLQFRQHDITRPLDVGGESTDVVYSRLSLHYFDDATTEGIFSEVFWILRPSGRFHFLCKSVEDPLYGKGVEIATDMFELNGHTRHFFSAEYTQDLMEDVGFVDLKIITGADKFYGEPSAYVMCEGRKP